jgi:hypothetical protein
MWNHCGFEKHCSSLADPTKKNIQRFKANFSLNRWIFFRTSSAILEPGYGPRRNDAA